MSLPTLRRLASTLHLYLGLALSAVLVTISLTGSALVFRDEIDRWLRPDLLRVDAEGERISVEAALQRAVRAVPEGEPSLFELPQSAEAPYVIWLADERHVFVDPYTGNVLGVRGSEEGLMNTLFALHAELLAGATGLWIVGISGLLLLLLAVTGLVLWWPSLRRLRVALVVAWRRGWRRLNYDLHRAGGLYALLFLLLTAATGSALVFYDSTGALLNWVAGSQEEPMPPPAVAAPPGIEQPALSLDAARNRAERALGGAAATFLYLPTRPEAPLTVRLRAPGEWHPNGRSLAYFDPYRGTLLRLDDAREAPLGSRLQHTAYPLHIGAVGGAFVRVLYVLLGLAPAVLTVTGVVIWFTRWRKQHRTVPRRARPAVPARLPDPLHDAPAPSQRQDVS